jgi:hypothetical protein
MHVPKPDREPNAALGDSHLARVLLVGVECGRLESGNGGLR